MGLLLSKLYNLYENFGGGGAPSRILMLGLDAAGKTTILYKVKLSETVCTIPTIGFNVETVSPMRGITFTVWDVGGQEKLRSLWKHYFQYSEGLIFVVDSCDRERMDEAREEMESILKSEDMRGVPVEIIANKQDLPNAMKVSDMIERLRLPQLRDHKWHIQPACATNGDGIWEAMSSMSDLVKDFRKMPKRWA